MRGMITSLADEAKVMKEGKTKKGQQYKLWVRNIMIDATQYSISGFSQSEVDLVVEGLKENDIVEFEPEEHGNYMRIKQGTEVKKVGSEPKQKKIVAFEQTDEKELIRKANELAEFLLKGIKENPDLIMQTRLKVFQELMLDRRTETIQRFKEKNMAKFRGS